MGAGLASALNSAKLSLSANMTTIDVIGHNIANANNPDYRRQKAIIEATTPIVTDVGPIGTGVQVSRIEAHYDRFLFRQLNYERSNQGMWESFAGSLDGVERVFDDPDGNGLSSQLSEFWGAWEDLANNPEGVVERETLVGKSQVLVSSLNSMGDDLNFQRQQINNYISKGVNDINQLADSIGDLNQTIHDSELSGGQNNDLRDKQLAQLSQLSDMIDIEYNEDNTGQLNIRLLGGKPLVLGNEVYHIASEADGQGDLHIYFGNEGIPNDDLIFSGKMKGWLDARTDLIQAQDDLNRMSSSLIFNVNQAHFQGYNLDGETSSTFFDHDIDLAVGPDNESQATLAFNADPASAEAPEGIAWATLANYDDFEIRFTGDHTDGSNVKDFIVVNTSTGEELDASNYEIDDTVAGDGVLNINFNDSSATSAADGYRLKLAYSAGDEPKNGDIFKLSFGMKATRTVELNQDLGNPDKIAASDNYFEVPGNNKIALKIVQLQHKQAVNGSHTFSEFHTSMVSRIGSASYTAQMRQAQSKMALGQLNSRKESDSGVSIDEEMVNLIKFQQSYQAAAKLVSTIDELIRAATNMTSPT